MSTPGDSGQSRAAAASPERLEWQSELDQSLADIDTRLRHPRRRASDNSSEQPTAPKLGEVALTSELLDEIAWRVAEQLRRTQAIPAPATTPTPAPPRAAARPAPPPPPEPERLPRGISMTIRVRKPLFRFRFWRRRHVRRESLISFADYRIT
jgi:hypothetical protein